MMLLEMIDALVSQNVHQGGFVSTRVQLAAALAQGCLHDHYAFHWSYHEIETADTELYFRCNLMKVTPVSISSTAPEAMQSMSTSAIDRSGAQRSTTGSCSTGASCTDSTANSSQPVNAPHARASVQTSVLSRFLVHHMPDKYVKEGTASVDKFFLTDDMLSAWLSRCDDSDT